MGLWEDFTKATGHESRPVDPETQEALRRAGQAAGRFVLGNGFGLVVAGIGLAGPAAAGSSSKRPDRRDTQGISHSVGTQSRTYASINDILESQRTPLPASPRTQFASGSQPDFSELSEIISVGLDVPGLKHQPGKRNLIYQNKYQIPPEVHRGILRASFLTKIPAIFAYTKFAPESAFNPAAENKTSNACGLPQFIPSVMRQYLHFYATSIVPGAPEGNLVIKDTTLKDKRGHVIHRYFANPRVPNAQLKIDSICKSAPHVTILSGFLDIQNISYLQNKLTPRNGKLYKVTPYDLSIANFAGHSVAANIIRAYNKSPNTPVMKFFGRRVLKHEANQKMLLNGRKSKTVAEYMALVHKKIGATNAVVTVDYRDWRKARNMLRTIAHEVLPQGLGPSPKL